jgi:hypothetical protein
MILKCKSFFENVSWIELVQGPTLALAVKAFVLS